MVFKFIVNFIRYLRLKRCKSSCCSVEVECNTPPESHTPTHTGFIDDVIPSSVAF